MEIYLVSFNSSKALVKEFVQRLTATLFISAARQLCDHYCILKCKTLVKLQAHVECQLYDSWVKGAVPVPLRYLRLKYFSGTATVMDDRRVFYHQAHDLYVPSLHIVKKKKELVIAKIIMLNNKRVHNN